MLLIFPALSKIKYMGSQNPHLGLVFLITGLKYPESMSWTQSMESQIKAQKYRTREHL